MMNNHDGVWLLVAGVVFFILGKFLRSRRT